jgi:hypothetical protein
MILNLNLTSYKDMSIEFAMNKQILSVNLPLQWGVLSMPTARNAPMDDPFVCSESPTASPAIAEEAAESSHINEEAMRTVMILLIGR